MNILHTQNPNNRRRWKFVRAGISKLYRPSIAIFSLLILAGGVYAAIEETANISGMSFTVGSEFGGGTGGGTSTNAALKLLQNLAGNSGDANLGDSVFGRTYTNINDVWNGDYLVKVYNKGSSQLALTAKSTYISDIDTLRDDIYVSIIEWNDVNSDGIVDSGEEGVTYGNDTILRLRNDTFALGNINTGQTRGFIYRFNGTGLSSANAGQSAVFDFPIVGVGM